MKAERVSEVGRWLREKKCRRVAVVDVVVVLDGDVVVVVGDVGDWDSLA